MSYKKNNFEGDEVSFCDQLNLSEMLRGIVSIFFSVGLMVLQGCSSSDHLRIADQMYFPLRVGNYQIYQVSETNIQNINCNDPIPPAKLYQLKTLVYDSVKNATGGYSYLIHRYTRPDASQPWTDLDTWSAKITNSGVIVTVGNTPYVRLIFPLMNNTKWNGNLYNDLAEEDYTLRNYGQSYQLLGGEKYSNTLTIVQSDNQDFFVFQDKRFEVYAGAVGLIYKETTQLTYFQDPCYGQQKVRAGIIYTQTLNSYGRE
jgi:hypothetical protein